MLCYTVLEYAIMCACGSCANACMARILSPKIDERDTLTYANTLGDIVHIFAALCISHYIFLFFSFNLG